MSKVTKQEKTTKKNNVIVDFIKGTDIYGVPVGLTYQNKGTF
jgi:hypothetical protein